MVSGDILHQIYRAVERLGGDMELLGAIGSWGDTLEDSEVLLLLEDWNEHYERRIEMPEESIDREVGGGPHTRQSIYCCCIDDLVMALSSLDEEVKVLGKFIAIVLQPAEPEPEDTSPDDDPKGMELPPQSEIEKTLRALTVHVNRIRATVRDLTERCVL